ncbi:hypothetical protein, partial [Caballeronia sp. AAUFL_F1_KS45]
YIVGGNALTLYSGSGSLAVNASGYAIFSTGLLGGAGQTGDITVRADAMGFLAAGGSAQTTGKLVIQSGAGLGGTTTLGAISGLVYT